MISCADSGAGRELFSSIMRVSRSWSRLPQFTPMRTGFSYRQANSIISANCGSRLLPRPDVAGVDAVLGQRLGALRMFAQQLVSVEMEVADDGNAHAHLRQPVADRRHGRGRRCFVDRDAHQLGARARQRLDLLRGALDVGRVGVGHRLDDDGRGTTDGHAANVHWRGSCGADGSWSLGLCVRAASSSGWSSASGRRARRARRGRRRRCCARCRRAMAVTA